MNRSNLAKRPWLAVTGALGTLALTSLALVPSAWAASWLDRGPAGRASWNHPGAALPKAPRSTGATKTGSAFRRPTSPEDLAVVKAGWSLWGASQHFNGLVVFRACTELDAAGNPDNGQAFVFNQGRFVGTLAPAPMAARSDGALTMIVVEDATHLRGEFVRYAIADPLCCPSRTSTASFALDRSGHLVLERVDTVKNE